MLWNMLKYELKSNSQNLRAKNKQKEKENEKLQKELKAVNNKYNEANIAISDYKFKIASLTDSEN